MVGGKSLWSIFSKSEPEGFELKILVLEPLFKNVECGSCRRRTVFKNCGAKAGSGVTLIKNIGAGEGRVRCPPLPSIQSLVWIVFRTNFNSKISEQITLTLLQHLKNTFALPQPFYFFTSSLKRSVYAVFLIRYSEIRDKIPYMFI